MIKLAWNEDKPNPKWQLKNKSDWRIKALSHGETNSFKFCFIEFRAFNLLADISFFEIKKNKKFLIRVPIACEIEYKVCELIIKSLKGFKALAISYP